MACPPFVIDPQISAMIESYRRTKAEAGRAAGVRASIESAGHYDRDASMPRPVVDGEAAQAERRAAVALADALLAWVDRHPA